MRSPHPGAFIHIGHLKVALSSHLAEKCPSLLASIGMTIDWTASCSKWTVFLRHLREVPRIPRETAVCYPPVIVEVTSVSLLPPLAKKMNCSTKTNRSNSSSALLPRESLRRF